MVNCQNWDLKVVLGRRQRWKKDEHRVSFFKELFSIYHFAIKPVHNPRILLKTINSVIELLLNPPVESSSGTHQTLFVTFIIK